MGLEYFVKEIVLVQVDATPYYDYIGSDEPDQSSPMLPSCELPRASPGLPLNWAFVPQV